MRRLGRPPGACSHKARARPFAVARPPPRRGRRDHRPFAEASSRRPSGPRAVLLVGPRAWRRLEALSVLMDLRAEGKIRHLGVTNWDSGEIAPFLDAGYEIVSNQVQYSVLDRRPAAGLAGWAAERDMSLLCYGTLAGGFLTEGWLGAADPGFSFENRSLVKYRLIIDEFGPWDLFQDLLAVLKSVGDRHGVSLSAVASRWVLDQPGVAAAIVGARYARHLPKTLQVFDIALDADDRAAIGAVIERAAGPGGDVFALERDRGGRHGSIMKYNLNARPDDPVHREAAGE